MNDAILDGEPEDNYCGKPSFIGLLIAMLLGFTFPVVWLLGCLQRGRVRAMYGIGGDSCGDCCCAVWCNPCMYTQMNLQLHQPRTVIVHQPVGAQAIYSQPPQPVVYAVPPPGAVYAVPQQQQPLLYQQQTVHYV